MQHKPGSLLVAMPRNSLEFLVSDTAAQHCGYMPTR